MTSQVRLFVCAVTLTGWLPAVTSAVPFREEETVRQSMAVLQQVMATPGSGIPRQLLANAHAVAIFPQVKGGAFVVGIRKGYGVLVARNQMGQWLAPQFLHIAGGSVGWQAGIQSTDVILVFRSRESLANLMRGKLTIGADASVAAGPLGRQVAAATDLTLNSEIYSYSRSRGVFLGVSFDGSVLQPDPQADARFYTSLGVPGQAAVVPAVAGQLTGLIIQYAGGPAVAAAPTQLVPNEPLEDQLQRSWQGLAVLLSQEWQQYLALPAAEKSANLAAYGQSLVQTLQRYDTVVTNPQYAELSARAEFQAVYSLLRHAVHVHRSVPGGQLQLPSPPDHTQSSSSALPAETRQR